MAFVVAKRPVAACPIKVPVYGDDGSLTEIEFVAQYHRHKLNQLIDLQDSITNKVRRVRGDEPLARDDASVIPPWDFASDSDFVKAKLAGWSGVAGLDGESLEFSGQALAELIDDWPELVTPLFNGFFEAHKEARLKN